jgi:SAM-dependent methyltransferase
MVGVTANIRVLDVGGGLGGAARVLAREFGCPVTVLDLTTEYCRVGEQLTAWTGLADRVTFRHGNALDMPFAAESFDLVWTQHLTMNIADKARLYAEIHRVLRPGGRLALHEILAGPEAPVLFPVPWARGPGISFLRPPAAVRALLADAGFRELAWEDETEVGATWFRERAAAVAGRPPPPLGLHLLLGDDLPAMLANLARNLAEGRVMVVRAVFARQ